MESWLSQGEMWALLQVILIDITLAGDNAIVVGLAAAGVEKSQRGRVIFWGIAAAVVMRIFFALVTTQLLQIPGLLFVGGLLLAWVCIKLGWELFFSHHNQAALAAISGNAVGGTPVETAPKPMNRAILQIIIADLSMSLDNVLAVAGAAMHHPFALVFGLVLSVALMGAAATLISRLLQRYPWIGWIGLAVIVYVSVELLIKGWPEVPPLIDHYFGVKFA